MIQYLWVSIKERRPSSFLLFFQVSHEQTGVPVGKYGDSHLLLFFHQNLHHQQRNDLLNGYRNAGEQNIALTFSPNINISIHDLRLPSKSAHFNTQKCNEQALGKSQKETMRRKNSKSLSRCERNVERKERQSQKDEMKRKGSIKGQ